MASPTFSPSQLEAYFNRIQLPPKYRPASSFPINIEFLTALHIHHITTIPYENLSMHYSKDRIISLPPQDLFRKIVTKNCGRGGYCMESSLLFLYILRDLGFSVYPTGVRIRLREDGVPVGKYTGLVHIALIVNFPSSTSSSEERFVIDTAFGGDGPTRPLPLKGGVVTTNLGTQEVRLQQDFIEEVRERADGTRQKFWIYQYRNSVEKEWNAFYCFREEEFLEADFGVMNYFTGALGPTFQVSTVLIVFFVRSQEEDGELRVTSKRMLVNGIVKENLGGRTEVVKVCKTEDERIKALNEFFGISLEEEEREAIIDRVTELKPALIV
jgi:arylamine N-acetyltransferase